MCCTYFATCFGSKRVYQFRQTFWRYVSYITKDSLTTLSRIAAMEPSKKR